MIEYLDKIIGFTIPFILIFIPIAMIVLIVIKFFIDFVRLLFGWLDIDDFNSMWGGAGPDCTIARWETAV